MDYMARKLVEEYRKWSLEVNVKKTEKMCIVKQQHINLEDRRKIHCCEECKYLGIKLTRGGTLDKAIKERNIQGKKAILMINGILWDQYIYI